MPMESDPSPPASAPDPSVPERLLAQAVRESCVTAGDGRGPTLTGAAADALRQAIDVRIVLSGKSRHAVREQVLGEYLDRIATLFPPRGVEPEVDERVETILSRLRGEIAAALPSFH